MAHRTSSTPDKNGRSTRMGLLLLKPSHYDDDGYVVEWRRVFISTHVAAVVQGILQDVAARQALGPDVSIDTRYVEEPTEQVNVADLCHWLDGFDRSAVLMVGVQTSQFPRAVDLGKEFQAFGQKVIVGGFHVSGAMKMVPDWTPALAAAREAGLTLFAGELEGRAEELLGDLMAGTLKPVYNHLATTVDMTAAPSPSLSEDIAAGTLMNVTGVDAGRGCPFVCSFCTIINVHGRAMRHRDPATVEAYVRHWVAKGRRHFLIVDDNFARCPTWREITAMFARVQREMNVELDIFIQVDALATRIDGFVEACRAAGMRRIFIGMESVRPDNLAAASKGQNKVHQMRDMLMTWKKAGCMIYGSIIVGLPNDTPDRVAEDIRTLQETLPVDVLYASLLTPFPGSADHKALVAAGTPMDEDFNRYDATHVVTDHPVMSRQELSDLYWRAYDWYYRRSHRKTVMARALYYGLPVTEIRRSLAGIYGASRFDRIHAVDAGVLRIRRRHVRRPGLPIEPLVPFLLRRMRDWLRVQGGYTLLLTDLMWMQATLTLRKWLVGLDAYRLDAPEAAVPPATDASERVPAQ